jgi:hypothetical protein
MSAPITAVSRLISLIPADVTLLVTSVLVVRTREKGFVVAAM